ncbi:MraY family glycosyltransferase [Spiribacter sp. 390]|uniref:MraY family glycosyltransferase n=1 Tax=Spiribacter pallidus TaxID=1987936 RepID=A0ABV3TCP7_9GAMM
MLGLLAAVAGFAGDWDDALIALTVVGVLAGFLCFNLRTPLRRRAAVFMGDAGSLPLGLVIVWLAIDISQHPEALVSPMGIAWVLALPVTDTLSLMFRRLLRGQSPFHADRNHLHHIFGRAGLGPGASAMLYSALTLALGFAGVGASLTGVPDVLLGAGLILLALAHYFFVRYAWRTARAIRRLRSWFTQSDQHRWPLVDRAALLGLYGMALAVPLGARTVGLFAGGLLAMASLAQWRALLMAVRGLGLARVSLALAVWLGLAIVLRPAASAEALPVLWLSGLLAVPAGWWFMRLRHHALPVFGLAVAALLAVWVPSVDWQMIEAGYFRTPGYWGDTQTGGLLLVLMLLVLVGGGASGLVNYRRRWRARASVLVAAVGATLLLVLLLGLQLRSAVTAGFVGLLAMVIAVLLHRAPKRLVASVTGGALAVVVAGVLLANALKPPGVSINANYLGPLQAVLVYLGGAPELGAARAPSISVRLDDWRVVGRALVERPLAGFGDPAHGASAGVIPPTRSAFAALVMTGGLTALTGFFALLVAWVRAVASAGQPGDWPMGQVIVAHGVLWSVLGLMLLSPVVGSIFNGVIITAVLALGVMARLDVARVDEAAGSLPRQTEQVVHFSERLSSMPRRPRRPGP